MSHEQCEAELTHTHGVSQCDGNQDHEGRHFGYCATCTEWEEGDRLEWDNTVEDWTTNRPSQKT